jgi:hypothetical protein
MGVDGVVSQVKGLGVGIGLPLEVLAPRYVLFWLESYVGVDLMRPATASTSTPTAAITSAAATTAAALAATTAATTSISVLHSL